MHTTRVSILLICLLCVAGIFKVISRSGGPGSIQMLTVSGAPGDGVCSNCHFGGQGGGAISLTGTGLTLGFIPGQTYDMQLRIEDTDAAIGGFQMVALDASQQSVGTFIPTSGMQTVTLNGKTYLEHNNPNIFDGSVPNTSLWNFQWKAPTTATSGITFYVAGVAADWLGTFAGDDVYMSSLSLTALPVEFAAIYTTARKYGQVEVYWETAWEVNSHEFVLERSADAAIFTSVGHLTASGNSDELSRYQMLDQVPHLGETYFYRVKEIDQDGKAFYSAISEVYVGQENSELLSIYPQPAILQKEVYLSYFSAQKEELSMVLFGIKGNRVREQKRQTAAGLNKIKLDISSLKSGYYYLVLRSGELEQWEKLVIAN